MIKSNRRRFLASAAGLAAVTVVNATPMRTKEKKSIAHQVYFWLKNPGSSEDRDELIKGVKTLRKIESVKKLTVGVVAATEKREVIDDTWSVSELVLFNDLAGEAAYQVDPIHLDFITNYSKLWSKVVVYDSSEV
ncbi:Dabb family protein [Daejeonella sp.]|uniref:Dabb family protein n=1 Tax=Daejeonella sp. TaxID=2805397 RepID=UPI003983AD06